MGLNFEYHDNLLCSRNKPNNFSIRKKGVSLEEVGVEVEKTKVEVDVDVREYD